MIKYIFPIISLILLIILQVHNVINFPVNRGFDIAGHIDYINFIKDTHTIPVATQGYEMYQPPLYYLLASLLPSLSTVRIINLISYLLIVITVFYLFKYTTKNTFLSLTGALLVSTLPITIYLTAPITNEFFTAAIVSLTLVWYVINYKKLTTRKLIFLGVLMGICLLSKFTALALVLCILIDLAINNKSRIFIPLVIMVIFAGWFYMRNYLLYKNPFVVNTDFPQFAITQSDGVRKLSYFINPNGFLSLDLFNAHHYSFWAGTYFSWFYDGHNLLIPVQPFSKIGIILIFFSIPIFFSFIYGLIQAAKNKSRTSLFMLSYLVIIFTAYVLFVLRITNFYAVKSSYMASALVPFVYFTVIGIEKYKKYYPLVYFYLFIYSLLIVKAFWILPNWYR